MGYMLLIDLLITGITQVTDLEVTDVIYETKRRLFSLDVADIFHRSQRSFYILHL